MRTLFVTALLLVLAGPAALAQGQSRPATGMGSKSMNSCTADQQKVCAGVPQAVLKECLVKNWDRIASDCQDALGTPLDRINPRGD